MHRAGEYCAVARYAARYSAETLSSSASHTRALVIGFTHTGFGPQLHTHSFDSRYSAETLQALTRSCQSGAFVQLGFLCSPSFGVMDPFPNRERLRVEKWKGFPGNFFGFTKMLYLVAVLFFRGKAAKFNAWKMHALISSLKPCSNVLKMGHLKQSIAI